jgi:hypothetical protein
MKNLSILLISLTIFFYSCSSNDDDTTTLTTEYTLIVKVGEGGTVSTEGGTYDEGTELLISALANEGYEFLGWQGIENNSSSINITLNSNLTITALFGKISLNLNVPFGNVDFVNSSTNCPLLTSLGVPGMCGTFEYGDDVTISALIPNCSQLVGWEGYDSNQQTITITLTENITLNPIFESTSEYSFEILKSGEGNVYNITGNVESGFQFNEFSGGCFSGGEEIMLTAVAADGYIFDGWIDDENERLYDLNPHRNFFGDDYVPPLKLRAKFIINEYLNDTLYGRLTNDSTPLDFVNVFLDEAETYGYNFKETVQNIIIDNNPGAYSLATCKENNYIHINLNQNGGGDSWTTWDFAQKLRVVYHELGHDLLHLWHVCKPGQHMTGWDNCMELYGNTDDLLYNGVEVNQNRLKYNADDPMFDWGRATRDMFEINLQNPYDCGIF